MVRITIGRLDNNKVFEVEDGTTINQAFTKAGYTKADNEAIQDLESNEYNGTEEVIAGKGYLLVQRVKSGC